MDFGFPYESPWEYPASPSRVAGSFLRLWRERVAGVSREGLAEAITALSPGTPPTTADMVYAWEKGQPPKAAAQLEALMRVMWRQGLTPGVIAQYQRTVLASCAARQYPGLFEDRDLSELADLEAVCARAHADPECLPTPILAVLVGDLEEAVRADHLAVTRRERERERQAALARVRAALAGRILGNQLRVVHGASRLFMENARFLREAFGADGLGGDLTPLGQQQEAAWVHAHAGLSERWARRMLWIAEAADRRGDRRLAARAFLRAHHCLGEIGMGAYEAARCEAHRRLEEAKSLDARTQVHVGHLDLVWAAIGEGLHEEAETLLADFERWCEADWERDTWWMETRMWLAIGRGDIEEAREILARGDPTPPVSGHSVRAFVAGAQTGLRLTYREHCRLLRTMAARQGMGPDPLPPPLMSVESRAPHTRGSGS